MWIAYFNCNSFAQFWVRRNFYHPAVLRMRDGVIVVLYPGSASSGIN